MGWKLGQLGPHAIQCGQCRGLPACHVSSLSVQPFGTIRQRYREDRHDCTAQDNGLIAYGEAFYKRSPKNSNALFVVVILSFCALSDCISQYAFAVCFCLNGTVIHTRALGWNLQVPTCVHVNEQRSLADLIVVVRATKEWTTRRLLPLEYTACLCAALDYTTHHLHELFSV